MRFIADRSISEKDFGKMVKDRRREMLEYVKQVRETQYENSNIQDVLIAFNNHFAGFGPQSVNDFLNLLNMSEIDWKTELERYDNDAGHSNTQFQSSLSDFTIRLDIAVNRSSLCILISLKSFSLSLFIIIWGNFLHVF